MSDEFIVIGKVVSTQGNRGEVNVLPLTDSIDRFKNLDNVFNLYYGKTKNLVVDVQLASLKGEFEDKFFAEMDRKYEEKSKKGGGAFWENKKAQHNVE